MTHTKEWYIQKQRELKGKKVRYGKYKGTIMDHSLGEDPSLFFVTFFDAEERMFLRRFCLEQIEKYLIPEAHTASPKRTWEEHLENVETHAEMFKDVFKLTGERLYQRTRHASIRAGVPNQIVDDLLHLTL